LRKLITIDDLMRTCGYACDSEENNGYGCSHKDSEDNTCHTFNCPIAVDASYNDLLELDPELAKEYEYQLKNKDPEEEGLDSDWMVQYSE
jgi:hypothetical protein